MKAGSGDGFLVWDKNGNGIIDDNTEMMSEFDEFGNKVFKNGFEKLAFYFDHDNDGIIKGDELKPLKVWVDIDGDAKTDKGELQPLSKYGITELIVPVKGKMVSTVKTKTTETKEQNQSSSARFSIEDLNPSDIPPGYDFMPDTIMPEPGKPFDIAINGSEKISGAMASVGIKLTVKPIDNSDQKEILANIDKAKQNLTTKSQNSCLAIFSAVKSKR